MELPRLYATFLLCLMSELFEEMPEVGDPDKPKLVFFFDEAHLLFDDAPKALLQKVEQVVRLIRSKGVGVYFVTQNPLDVPDTVSSQLGNRVQHALRAFTPLEQKAVKAAATTFRANPAFDTEKAIMELASARRWSRHSMPRVAHHCRAHAHKSAVLALGPITDAERKAVIKASPVAGVYEETVDRESASEICRRRRRSARMPPATPPRDKEAAGSRSDGFWTTLGKQLVKSVVPPRRGSAKRCQGFAEKGGRGGGGSFSGGITG